jgi:RNA polymerase sigma-70 factor (ECF subfamily)
VESLAVTYSPANPTAPCSQTRERLPDNFIGDEVALLEGIQSGDPRAIATFVERFEHDVRSVLTRILGSTPDVSDALQDTFIRALKNALQVREALALRFWVRRVAASVAFDHLRQRQRLRWYYGSECGPIDEPADTVSPEDHAAFCDVHRVLEMMPRRERAAFYLRYVDEMELKEIALTCSVSVATIKRRLARANTRFRTLARHQPGLVEWMGQKSA